MPAIQQNGIAIARLTKGERMKAAWANMIRDLVLQNRIVAGSGLVIEEQSVMFGTTIGMEESETAFYAEVTGFDTGTGVYTLKAQTVSSSGGLLNWKDIEAFDQFFLQGYIAEADQWFADGDLVLVIVVQNVNIISNTETVFPVVLGTPTGDAGDIDTDCAFAYTVTTERNGVDIFGTSTEPVNYRTAKCEYKPGTKGLAWLTSSGGFEFFAIDEGIIGDQTLMLVPTEYDAENDCYKADSYKVTVMEISESIVNP